MRANRMPNAASQVRYAFHIAFINFIDLINFLLVQRCVVLCALCSEFIPTKAGRSANS